MQLKTNLDTTTALAFVLPDEFVEKINLIRQKYDKAVNRWPPHINFLFPFLPVSEFEIIESQLESLQQFGSFQINFNRLGYFSQGKDNITFHLKLDYESEIKFQSLFKEIRKLLPNVTVKRPDFHPHLTLGQCQISNWSEIEQEILNLIGNGFIVNCNHLFCLHRNSYTDDKMEPFVRINLE